MNRLHRHAGIFAFEAKMPEDDENEEIVIPENLEEVSDEDLEALETRAVDAFDTLYGSNPSDADSVATLADLAEAIETVRTEKTRRADARAEAQANAAELNARIHGQVEGDEEEESEAEAEEPETPTPAPAPEPEQPESVAAAAASREPIKVPAKAAPRRLNISLAEIRARAPVPETPQRLDIVAAADVPGINAGRPFENLGALSAAMRERARTTPISVAGNVAGPKVASIALQYDHKLALDSSTEEVERVMKAVTNPDSLVAGGGWCAPSETTYSFFDITCEDGMIDLPEVGISRGGIRFPVSPSLADVFTGSFDVTTNPWLWTETDDQATVTGTPNKPCVRVPCPSFTDRRLECYGICLTAGNLTDNAFPEATERQIGLLRSAHYHAMNQRYIATMVALSTSPSITGGFFNDAGAISSDILAAAGWSATDYRTRFGMCESDVLELVAPFWLKEVIRSDVAQRTGVDLLAVTDAQINEWFDVRNVRVQWVKDWQVRGTNQPGGSTPTVLYPATVDFLLYAAGTFVRGNGMTLDLGIVRDSVLNAENDHTALWTEECHLIAMMGHASRRYTVNICAAGRTGVANLADCKTA